MSKYISILKFNKTKKAFIIEIHEFWVDPQYKKTKTTHSISLHVLYLSLCTYLILKFLYQLIFFLSVFPWMFFLSSSPSKALVSKFQCHIPSKKTVWLIWVMGLPCLWVFVQDSEFLQFANTTVIETRNHSQRTALLKMFTYAQSESMNTHKCFMQIYHLLSISCVSLMKIYYYIIDK